MKHNFNSHNFGLRLLSAPFVLCLLTVAFTYHLIIRFYRFMKYGGEMITFTENDRPTVDMIYQELKKQQK